MRLLARFAEAIREKLGKLQILPVNVNSFDHMSSVHMVCPSSLLLSIFLLSLVFLYLVLSNRHSTVRVVHRHPFAFPLASSAGFSPGVLLDCSSSWKIEFNGGQGQTDRQKETTSEPHTIR